MDRRLQTFALDLLPGIALALFLVVVSPLDDSDAAGHRDIDALARVMLAAAGMTLALWRVAPLAGYLTALAVTLGFFALDYPGGPIYMAPLVTLLILVATRPPHVWVPSLAGGTLALGAVTVAAEGWDIAVVGAMLVWSVPPLALAAALRQRRDQQAIAQAETRGRVTEERLRMAQELHDVVGHSLSTISLHAGVAERALDTKPEQVRESIHAIRQASKEALGELRAVLGILREDGTAGVAPTPSLDAIGALVRSMRDAGLDVEFDEARPEADRVPDVVGTAAYRIVQESLTNVARHAGGATVKVKLRVGRGGVEVEVRDNGPGPVNGVRSGNGITGMRERAAALGGELHVGGMRGRGFFVRAKLPVRRG